MFGLETVFIVGVGMLMHLYQISISQLGISMQPNMAPNFASCLFVFTVLLLLIKQRPIWPSALRKPPDVLLLPLEVALILFGTECLYRKIWVLVIHVLSLTIYWLYKRIILILINFWSEDDYHAVRVRVAIVVFIFFSHIQTALYRTISYMMCENEEAEAAPKQDENKPIPDRAFRDQKRAAFEQYKAAMEQYEDENEFNQDGTEIKRNGTEFKQAGTEFDEDKICFDRYKACFEYYKAAMDGYEISFAKHQQNKMEQYEKMLEKKDLELKQYEAKSEQNEAALNKFEAPLEEDENELEQYEAPLEEDENELEQYEAIIEEDGAAVEHVAFFQDEDELAPYEAILEQGEAMLEQDKTYFETPPSDDYEFEQFEAMLNQDYEAMLEKNEYESEHDEDHPPKPHDIYAHLLRRRQALQKASFKPK